MSDGVPNLRGGTRATVLAIVIPVATLAVMFGGFVWQAAKYPDRAEFTRVKDKLDDVDKSSTRTADKVGYLQTSVERVEADVKAQLNRIEINQAPARRK